MLSIDTRIYLQKLNGLCDFDQASEHVFDSSSYKLRKESFEAGLVSIAC